jgi:hypothetical protein
MITQLVTIFVIDPRTMTSKTWMNQSISCSSTSRRSLRLRYRRSSLWLQQMCQTEQTSLNPRKKLKRPVTRNQLRLRCQWTGTSSRSSCNFSHRRLSLPEVLELLLRPRLRCRPPQERLQSFRVPFWSIRPSSKCLPTISSLRSQSTMVMRTSPSSSWTMKLLIETCNS